MDNWKMSGYVGYPSDLLPLLDAEVEGTLGPIGRAILAKARAISLAWWALWDAMVAEERRNA